MKCIKMVHAKNKFSIISHIFRVRLIFKNRRQDPKSFMDAYNMDRNNRGGGYNDDRGQIMDLMDMRVDMGNMGNNRGNNGGSGGGVSGVGGGGSGVGGGVGGSGSGGPGGGNVGGGGRWQGGNDRNRQDDFPNKRRRY